MQPTCGSSHIQGESSHPACDQDPADGFEAADTVCETLCDADRHAPSCKRYFHDVCELPAVGCKLAA